MEREKLLGYFEKRYLSKREILSRIPLGIQPDTLWREILHSRRAKSEVLPLYGPKGAQYWYVTTEKMILSSEKIVEALFEYEDDFDPYEWTTSVLSLEEVFYTSYVEGAQITMQDAMNFLSEERQPKDIEEQLIANNRAAGGFAAKHLASRIDETFLRELSAILTDGMDDGGGEYRATEETDFISVNGENYPFPCHQLIPDRVRDLCAYLASPNVHPLIKAAVAQGYILVLRPFAEGNDRLGRILSSMLLHRCGYGFFGEVSLSALIARKSYAYYEAAENILRDENGGDFTYFIEYFLELLSRAVDERRYRLGQQNEQRMRQEPELARQPLAEKNNTCQSQKDESKLKRGAAEAKDTNLEDALRQCLRSNGALTRKFAGLLLDMLENGQKTFTAADIIKGCGVTSDQAQGLIKRFRHLGLIESVNEKVGSQMVYRIKKAPTPKPRPAEAAGGAQKSKRSTVFPQTSSTAA